MEEIRAYHYTNLEALRSMKRGGISGHFVGSLDTFKGIIPRKRFIRIGQGKNLPNIAYEGVIEGLLSPKPLSWTKNAKFPGVWQYLFHDLCRTDNLALISFDLTPKDKAYVVERAYMENELYRESKRQGKSNHETMSYACKKYWESRVPVFEYRGSYCLPQLAIWSPIEFERLNLEWVLPSRSVWEKVLEETENQFPKK
ncbi:Uncharacterised protein [uncultured archaeon]|nr:Uncharacterised protein [uncultured archaeon]